MSSALKLAQRRNFRGPRPMTMEELRMFSELIHDTCGVSHGLDSNHFLTSKLGPRLEELELPTYTDYFHYIRYDRRGSGELVHLIESIVTHETYLFREQYQLDALNEEIFPLIHRRNQQTKRVRLWSAGCSTGEEAYTLAILAARCPLFHDWDLRVYGTDISTSVLETARRGVYGRPSLRAAPSWAVDRYMQPTGQRGRYTIHADIRGLCQFEQLNLLHTKDYSQIDSPDAVLCRNVLIYFSDTARSQVLEGIHRHLEPGGHLLLGHSESLLNTDHRFDAVQLEHDLVYRKSETPPHKPTAEGGH